MNIFDAFSNIFLKLKQLDNQLEEAIGKSNNELPFMQSEFIEKCFDPFTLMLAFFVLYLGMFLWVQKFVTRLGIRALLFQFFAWGPIAFLYFYFRISAPVPLISFFGSTGYFTIFLTFLTYIFNRVAILWGTMGVLSISSRYVLYWFGLYGGIWSPFVRISGWFYQPWVRIFPYCIGGMVDFGPIIGQQIHRRVAFYFSKILWCPLPPGILTYDEIDNKFTVHYQLFESFCSVFFDIVPKRRLADVNVYLPLPKNCPGYGTGYLLPMSANKIVGSDLIRSYDIISEMSRLKVLTSELLDRYFFDARFINLM